MTDTEIIDKVDLAFDDNDYYGSTYGGEYLYYLHILVRYTRWLERAKIYGVIAKGRPRVGIND